MKFVHVTTMELTGGVRFVKTMNESAVKLGISDFVSFVHMRIVALPGS